MCMKICIFMCYSYLFMYLFIHPFIYFLYIQGEVQIEQSNCKHFTMNPIVGVVTKSLAFLWALVL